jgi:protein-disulfide isomerase
MTAVIARIAAGLALLLSAVPAALAQHPAQAERPGDHAIGDPDAPLTIVEYASFACPHCAHFQEAVWPTVKADFIDTGRVRWVFRPILTNPVQLAAASTILAECAADDRFFEAADLLFERQHDIFETARAGGDVLGAYNDIAGEVGLTPEDFSACLQDPAMNQALNDMAQQAAEYEIPGTPSFVVGDDVLIATTRAQGAYFYYGDEPLEINGERVAGQMDGDSFSRIVLHFLNESDSEN